MSGQVIRIQADVPYSFLTFDMLNALTSGTAGSAITFNIIEEGRYFGE